MKIELAGNLDTSKLTNTGAGKQLEQAGGFITYVANAVRQFTQALTNRLTFRDNFNCIQSTVSFTHLTNQIVNTDGKNPTGIIPLRTLSTTNGVQSVIWYINESNQTVVNIEFRNAPSSPIQVILAIFFE